MAIDSETVSRTMLVFCTLLFRFAGRRFLIDQKISRLVFNY